MAGILAANDVTNGYWYSPSNVTILGIDGVERLLTADLEDPACDVNQLNAVGKTFC